jgi:uncharacterized protein YecT (DUF1311 family)
MPLSALEARLLAECGPPRFRHGVTIAMKLKVVIIALTVLSAPTTVLADSSELASCMDKVDLGALKDQQRIACEAQELARQDRRLNDKYKKLQAQAAGNGVAAVKALALAERQWLSYRESWCAFDVIEGGAPGPDFNRVACMKKMTKSQADLLHSEQY